MHFPRAGRGAPPLTAQLVCLVVLGSAMAASCGSQDPQEPPTGGGGSGGEVRSVGQGTQTQAEGLTIGLISVQDGEAALGVGGHISKGSETLRGRAGDRIAAGDYTIELVEVHTAEDVNDEFVRFIVTPPEGG